MREIMKDRLDIIFEIQREFNKEFLAKIKGQNLDGLTVEQTEDLVKDYILHLIKEATELLDNFKWKMHHFNEKSHSHLNSDNQLEEIVDITKYLVGICNLLGFDSEDLSNRFVKKSILVQHRLKQDLLMKQIAEQPDVKIAAIDIDGVLNNYPFELVELAKKMFKKDVDLGFEVHRPNLSDLLPFEKLKALKHEYRSNGSKANLSAAEFASEFLRNLKELGYTIILVSSRPVKKYASIEHDTLKWLRDQDLAYDLLFWSDEKEEFLLNRFSEDKLALFIDDDPLNCLKVKGSSANTKVVHKINSLICHPVSALALTRRNVISVDSLSKIVI
jgi:hypothetical protein